LKSHAPALQTAVAPETLVRQGEHIAPHVATSLSLTHLPLQSCVPDAHSQRPWEQLAPLGHFIAHWPQFATSDFVSTHALSHAVSL
jgi:hypothetical protein